MTEENVGPSLPHTWFSPCAFEGSSIIEVNMKNVL